MKKVIALGGSNSKTSINKALASYVAHQLEAVDVEVLDLNDFELPIYSIEIEQENGIPEPAKKLLNTIKASNGIVLSLAEHNGAYSAAFKNAFDWMSRLDGKLWSDKPMFLMATSPGARGGATVLEIAKGRFPYMGGNIVADFTLPSFGQNFSNDGIVDESLNLDLNEKIKTFQNAI